MRFRVTLCVACARRAPPPPPPSSSSPFDHDPAVKIRDSRPSLGSRHGGSTAQFRRLPHNLIIIYTIVIIAVRVNHISGVYYIYYIIILYYNNARTYILCVHVYCTAAATARGGRVIGALYCIPTCDGIYSRRSNRCLANAAAVQYYNRGTHGFNIIYSAHNWDQTNVLRKIRASLPCSAHRPVQQFSVEENRPRWWNYNTMSCFDPSPSIVFTHTRQAPRLLYKELLSTHKHVSVGAPALHVYNYIIIYNNI